MDPLSDVLSLLSLRSHMSGGFDIGGFWSFRFGPFEGIKFFAVLSGEYWVAVDGVPEPAHVGAGDCFLLTTGRPFRLATDLSLADSDAGALMRHPPNGGVRVVNGGGQSFSIGGHVTFANSPADALLGVLPPIMHVRSASDGAAMRWSLERLMLELREPRPGGVLVAQQLATVVVVQALRLHLDVAGAGTTGWLSALGDRPLCAALEAMHDEPAHRWTLQALAARAGMSRTAFAVRFKEKVGQPPMEYLTRWRMRLAADRLRHSGDAIATIGRSFCYESESAFSAAFKRVMGCSPRQYGWLREGKRSGAVPRTATPEP